MFSEMAAMQSLTEQQRLIFMAEMAAQRKDTVIAILLAFFLGSFGAHRFYLGENSLGILYACFFWTGIPGIIALVECFFLPGRVQQYNAMKAMEVAAAVRSTFPLAA